MSNARDLWVAQRERLARLDPMLPPAAAPPKGEAITAALPDGGTVAGVLVRTTYPPGSLARTWSTTEVVELTPLLGETGLAGMHTLLAAWRTRLPALSLPDNDSACVVTWPSRDVTAARALLDHGFAPLTVIAVRTGGRPYPRSARVPGLVVRRARPADLDAVVELAMAELAYSALVGATVVREDAAELKRGVLAGRLDRGDPVWVAEQDGLVVGLAECGVSDAAPGTWTGTRLPAGRWAYVNCAAVLPGARGQGVGRSLLDTVHAAFHAGGVMGSYLYYSPANPLSSVFWPRQGYRPLWTVWEVRPAGALR